MHDTNNPTSPGTAVTRPTLPPAALTAALQRFNHALGQRVLRPGTPSPGVPRTVYVESVR